MKEWNDSHSLGLQNVVQRHHMQQFRDFPSQLTIAEYIIIFLTLKTIYLQWEESESRQSRELQELSLKSTTESKLVFNIF